MSEITVYDKYCEMEINKFCKLVWEIFLGQECACGRVFVYHCIDLHFTRSFFFIYFFFVKS